MNANNIPIEKYNPFDVEKVSIKKMELDRVNENTLQKA